MSAVACVKWKNQSFEGFWFLTNFLREEGVKEKPRKEIIDDLTRQYEHHITTKGNGRYFGPGFIATSEVDSASIKMCNPATSELIGDVNLSLVDGIENASIIPF